MDTAIVTALIVAGGPVLVSLIGFGGIWLTLRQQAKTLVAQGVTIETVKKQTNGLLAHAEAEAKASGVVQGLAAGVASGVEAGVLQGRQQAADEAKAAQE